MTGLTSRLYALPDIQNECYLLTNCPYEVDTFRRRLNTESEPSVLIGNEKIIEKHHNQ
jgi:hypothetical protein